MDIREKTIETEKIYDGKIIKLSVDTVITPGGNKATREIIRHPGGVGIVAIDDDDMIDLVEQYRIPYDEILLEIPAGKIDPGETDVKEAAARELREETGLVADTLEFVGNFYPSVGFLDEDLRLFAAKGLRMGETDPDEDEFLNLVKIPFDKAVEMVMNNTIKDGKTIAAILKVNIIRKLSK